MCSPLVGGSRPPLTQHQSLDCQPAARGLRVPRGRARFAARRRASSRTLWRARRGGADAGFKVPAAARAARRRWPQTPRRMWPRAPQRQSHLRVLDTRAPPAATPRDRRGVGGRNAMPLVGRALLRCPHLCGHGWNTSPRARRATASCCPKSRTNTQRVLSVAKTPAGLSFPGWIRSTPLHPSPSGFPPPAVLPH